MNFMTTVINFCFLLGLWHSHHLLHTLSKNTCIWILLSVLVNTYIHTYLDHHNTPNGFDRTLSLKGSSIMNPTERLTHLSSLHLRDIHSHDDREGVS